jgi:chromosome segregation ATPase
LRTTVDNMKTDISRNLKTDFSSTADDSHVHLGLLDHKKHIESVISTLKEMKQENILQSAARAKADVASGMSSQLEFSRLQQQHMHEGLTNHKERITSLDQGLLNHRDRIKTMERTHQEIKQVLQNNDKKMKTMEATHQDIEQVLQNNDKKMKTMEAAVENNYSSQKNERLNNKREIESLQNSVRQLHENIQQLKSDQHVTTMSKDRTSNDHVINKLEALERQTLAEIRSLKLGHNMLVDANKATDDKVTSMSKDCDQPQEKIVQFETNSYVRPPRSKF